MSTLDESNAALPDNQYLHESTLNQIEITESEVLEQLKSLDINKAFGPDNISPRLLKEGADHLAPILKHLFTTSIQAAVFPAIWKQANVSPVHKKDDKCQVSNYRPISLISCVGKLLERIIFKHVYNHLRDNHILSQVQSGFLPGRSTTAQLLEMYDIFSAALDCNKEMRVVFLDIAKAFDRVWFKGLLYKLRKSGIGGPLLQWFHSYLLNRQQRVVINGVTSAWKEIRSGVPQGSVLGPLLFLIYINDITNVVKDCKIRLYADDTCLFLEVADRESTAKLIDQDLKRIAEWAKKWLLTFSPTKTKSLVISNKKDLKLNPPIYFNNIEIEEVSSYSYLGLTLTQNLRWGDHVNVVSIKARKRLSMMLPLKYRLDRKTLQTMFLSFVSPIMDYGMVIWGGSYDCDINKLDKINNDGMRLITGAPSNSNVRKLHAETGLLSFRDKCAFATILMLYKVLNNLAPNFLNSRLPEHNPGDSGYNLRNSNNIGRLPSRLETHRRSFFPRAINLWNAIPNAIRSQPSLSAFKAKVRPTRDCTNALYYYGQRWPSVHHSRLRMGCSKLNFDLCYSLHVKDDPSCRCGARFETASHFLIECPLYTKERENLQKAVGIFDAFNLRSLLHGNKNLSFIDNTVIFDAVHKFIIDSERF